MKKQQMKEMLSYLGAGNIIFDKQGRKDGLYYAAYAIMGFDNRLESQNVAEDAEIVVGYQQLPNSLFCQFNCKKFGANKKDYMHPTGELFTEYEGKTIYHDKNISFVALINSKADGKMIDYFHKVYWISYDKLKFIRIELVDDEGSNSTKVIITNETFKPTQRSLSLVINTTEYIKFSDVIDILRCDNLNKIKDMHFEYQEKGRVKNGIIRRIY